MARTENIFVNEFKNRTKRFAIETLKLCDELPFNQNSTRIIASQLGRSASSTAANYRAACVSRSAKEFVAKMSISLEESDESSFWLELLDEGDFYTNKERIKNLLGESEQLTKIIGKARFTASNNLNNGINSLNPKN
ncbi:MAG: four helix bundle protein [Flavobacteriales bacterium]|nr:four helix bundle protein [Flavobacteriales bacterium]